jgi:hypothetical protein
MRKRFIVPILTLSVMAFLWQSCSEKEQLGTALISEYNPLQVGKYITYKLDSTVYISLNTVKAVYTYHVQDRVDAEITDNQGRKAFRIRRLMRSKTDTTQWIDNASFVVTPLDKSLEFVDNNLRYIRLQEPIRNDFTWKGNSYINSFTDPELQYLDNWEYFYEGTDEPYTIGTKTFPETVIVNQRDEVINNPEDKTNIFAVNKSVEVFAKGIGLIYKDFLHETWQPPNSTSPGGFYEPSSYGIRLTYLNHN